MEDENRFKETVQARIRLEEVCGRCNTNLTAEFVYWQDIPKRTNGGYVREVCYCRNPPILRGGATFSSYAVD